MATRPTSSEPASPRQAFTFYAADGRVYVSSAEQKLIDLGALTEQDNGFAYLLDGNQLRGEGLPSAQAALRHIVDHIRYLYLDGQFTALADMHGNQAVHLDGAPRIDVMVDVLQRGEPMEDATV
jgi:hypothetical protein